MARLFTLHNNDYYCEMQKKKKSEIIPDQKTGKAIDAESSVELETIEEAKLFFAKVKERLQEVNRWREFAGALSANFQLVDANGHEIQRKAHKRDYFRIDIPGPGTVSGEGYDWVQIEEVEIAASDYSDRFGFRVRPTENPLRQSKDVAHFYSSESTSSFIIERSGNKITASVYDRNTKPNTDAHSPTDKIRDVIVGAAGAATFSKIQWKKLTDGLVSL